MIDDTATTLIARAAALIDVAYHSGLDQPDLSDRALFALHEAAGIQTDIMRLASIHTLHPEPDAEPAAALAMAADQLRDAAQHVEASERPDLTRYEQRLRQLVEQVQP